MKKDGNILWTFKKEYSQQTNKQTKGPPGQKTSRPSSLEKKGPKGQKPYT